MSERLQKLAERLDALPDPADMMKRVQYSLMKAQGKVLSTVSRAGDSATQARETLEASRKNIDMAASMLGERDEAVLLLRKMLAIATAIAEGRPEPTDAELDSRHSAGGSTGSGCFSLLLAIATGL